jgi:hypothetical protein
MSPNRENLMWTKTRLVVAGTVMLSLAAACWSMAMVGDGGSWPKSWPEKLEPLRNQARSYQLAAGNQEDVYEITFKDHTQFEAAWPAILSLKTPEAPLRLSSPRPRKTGDLFVMDQPCVRVYTPARNAALGAMKDGKRIDLIPHAPWPRYLYSDSNALPEYVYFNNDANDPRWIPAHLPGPHELPKGFYCRARVEIELVADGNTIDMNRIPLPPNTPIIDERFREKP